MADSAPPHPEPVEGRNAVDPAKMSSAERRVLGPLGNAARWPHSTDAASVMLRCARGRRVSAAHSLNCACTAPRSPLPFGRPLKAPQSFRAFTTKGVSSDVSLPNMAREYGAEL